MSYLFIFVFVLDFFCFFSRPVLRVRRTLTQLRRLSVRSSASTKLFQRLFATDCKRNERKSRCKTPRNDLPEDRDLQTGPLPDPYRNGTPGSAHEAPFYTWLGPGIVSGRCHGLPSEARRGTRDRSKQRCTVRTGGPNALGFQAAWCFALRLRSAKP